MAGWLKSVVDYLVARHSINLNQTQILAQIKKQKKTKRSEIHKFSPGKPNK